MHIDFAVSEDCLNLYESYGEICVKCNACGRFDESTKHEDHLKVLKRQLQENVEFDDWFGGMEELQRANVSENIEELEGDIKKVEAILREKGEI